MNTLKSVMVVGALAVVGYGVYAMLNNNSTTPPGAPPWPTTGAPGDPNNPAAQPNGGLNVSMGSPAPPPGSAAPQAPPAPGAPGASAMPGYTPQPVGGGVPLVGADGRPVGVGSVAPANPYDRSAAPLGAAPAPVAAPGLYGQAPAGAPASGAPGLYGQAPAGMQPGGAMPGAVPGAPSASPSRYESLTTGAQHTNRFGTTPVGSAPGGMPVGVTPAGMPPMGGMPVAGMPAPGMPGGVPAGVAPLGGMPAGVDMTSQYARSMPAALQAPAPTDLIGSPSANFDATMSAARGQLDRGQLDAALVTLSGIYDDPRLNEQQQEQLNGLLDQVAGTVIYSRKFPVGAPYRVAPGGEKLADVAQKFNVPPGLLAKINGLKEGADLSAGQELKVLKGPFHAQVNVPKRTLTLMVEGRYAGRFPISLSDDEFKQIQGTYTIENKKREQQRYMELKPAAGGITPPVSLAIVGMADPTTAERGQAQGVIAVNPKNADDLFDILSQGSRVTIRR